MAANRNHTVRASNGNISCVCINAEGRNKTWEFTRVYTDLRYDMIFIQEIAMNEDYHVAFVGQAHNWGYQAFLTNCKEITKRDGQESLQGGVAVLVNRRWKARRASSHISEDGENVLVGIGCAIVGSVYSRPRRLDGDLEESLRRDIFAEDSRRAWMLAGDWNLECQENIYQEALAERGAYITQTRETDGEPTPTRWRGERAVDYTISNRPRNIKHMRTDDVKLSDHKPICWELDMDLRRSME